MARAEPGPNQEQSADVASGRITCYAITVVPMLVDISQVLRLFSRLGEWETGGQPGFYQFLVLYHHTTMRTFCILRLRTNQVIAYYLTCCMQHSNMGGLGPQNSTPIHVLSIHLGSRRGEREYAFPMFLPPNAHNGQDWLGQNQGPQTQAWYYKQVAGEIIYLYSKIINYFIINITRDLSIQIRILNISLMKIGNMISLALIQRVRKIHKKRRAL